jgi:hypothetical protein
MKLSRARVEAEDPVAAPGPSPAMIAAGVRKHGELQLGELRLARLVSRIGELREHQRAIYADHPGDLDGSDAGREVNRLAKAAEELEQEANDLRVELAPARRAHAERVAAALRPIHHEEARGLVQDLARIRARISVIHECEVATTAAGVPGEMFAPTSYVMLVTLGHLEILTHSIAGAGE